MRSMWLAAGLAVWGLGLGAAAADTVTVKVATFVPEKSVGVSKVIKPWMEAVQAEVGDKVRLQAFWGGTLGKSPFKQYELVKNGVADVTWVLPGYTAGQFPELQIMELPFMAETAMEASIAGWRLYEQGMLTGLNDTHLIGFWASAPSIVFTREPMQGLADLENKRIRSVGAVHAAWLKSIGAAPQTMSSSEMNEALNRGTLDGVIQGWTGMRTFKTMPLVADSYNAPIGVIPFLLLMNKNTWEKLPADVQAAMTKHGGLAMAKAGGAAYDAISAQIEGKAKADGQPRLIPVADADRARYAKEAGQVHDWWVGKSKNGKAVFDAYAKALEEARSGG